MKHMIQCPPHCVMLHKIWVSYSTAPTQGRRFTPAHPPRFSLPNGHGACCGGGAWHSSGVCHGLQHMRALASFIPFFSQTQHTATVWAASKSGQSRHLSGQRLKEERRGFQPLLLCLSQSVCVCVSCIALHCVSPGRCGCWMRQLGTCCSSNERECTVQQVSG